MDYKYSDILKLINKGMKPMLAYHIQKEEEVIKNNWKSLDDFFKILTRLGEHARQSCVITCSGYDDIPDELYEIAEVRKFVQKLFRRYPYILYYINRQVEGDHWLLGCIADEVRAIVPQEHRLSASELAEKFGYRNIPQHQLSLLFNGNNLAKILRPILDHGKKIGDIEGAKDIVIQYALVFDHTTKTLEELGLL
jgi:hypothetical protein